MARASKSFASCFKWLFDAKAKALGSNATLLHRWGKYSPAAA